MAEFNIVSFTERLREMMYNYFPFLPKRGVNASGTPKHKDYNEEIRNVAFKNNPTIMVDENQYTFEIGNEYSEEHYPYYHILQNTPYIRKRNKGTKKTRGSQANVEVGKRDYEFVTWNGKTFTKEYTRNVRGKRQRINKVSHWATDYKGNRIFINRESNSYLNEHYNFINKMLNDIILDNLAIEFNLKKGRTVNEGLGEEWGEQSFDYIPTDILQIFDSFEE